jgi:hypothetical protein
LNIASTDKRLRQHEVAGTVNSLDRGKNTFLEAVDSEIPHGITGKNVNDRSRGIDEAGDLELCVKLFRPEIGNPRLRLLFSYKRR